MQKSPALKKLAERGEQRKERARPKIPKADAEPVGVKTLAEVEKIVRQYLSPLRRIVVEHFGQAFLGHFSWGKFSISFEGVVKELTQGIWNTADHAILQDSSNLLLMLILHVPKKYGHVAALLCYRFSFVPIVPEKLLIALYERTINRTPKAGMKHLATVWKITLEKLQLNPAFKSHARFDSSKNKIALSTLEETNIQIDQEFYIPTPGPASWMKTIERECHEQARLFSEMNPHLGIYHGTIGRRHYEFSPQPERDMSKFRAWLPVLFSLVLKGDDEWEKDKTLSMQNLIAVAQKVYAKEKIPVHNVEAARVLANAKSSKFYLDDSFTKLFIDALETKTPPFAGNSLGTRVDAGCAPMQRKKFVLVE